MNTAPAEHEAVQPCDAGHDMRPAEDEIGGRYYWWAYCVQCPFEDHTMGAHARALRQLEEDWL